MKILNYLSVMTLTMFLASSSAFAQGDKDKVEKEQKREREKDKDKKEFNKSKDKKFEKRSRSRSKGVIGRVISPGVKTAPRRLVQVPRGHYPPPGSCRIWYPTKPPGHQPPPTSCDNLRGIKLERGAFILHGDKAYDAEFDWREAERRNPRSVDRDILDIVDIIFPS